MSTLALTVRPQPPSPEWLIPSHSQCGEQRQRGGQRHLSFGGWQIRVKKVPGVHYRCEVLTSGVRAIMCRIMLTTPHELAS